MADTIRLDIISEIFKCIEAIDGATNVVVENKGKLITFELNNESFKIDLIQKRNGIIHVNAGDFMARGGLF